MLYFIEKKTDLHVHCIRLNKVILTLTLTLTLCIGHFSGIHVWMQFTSVDIIIHFLHMEPSVVEMTVRHIITLCITLNKPSVGLVYLFNNTSPENLHIFAHSSFPIGTPHQTETRALAHSTDKPMFPSRLCVDR